MKKIFISSFAVFVLSLFMSCQGVIFDEINKEVALEGSDISGEVLSIARFTDSENKEFIFVACGTVFKKNVDSAAKGTPSSSKGNWIGEKKGEEEDWVTYEGYMSSIISNNKKELYALSFDIQSVDSEGENLPQSYTLFWSSDEAKSWKAVKYSDGSEVKVVTSGTSIGADGVRCLFGTNAPKLAHRRAFFTVPGKYYDTEEEKEKDGFNVYMLEDGFATRLDSVSDSELPVDGEKSEIAASKYKYISAAYLGDKFYFSTDKAITTDETYSKEAKYIYSGTDTNLKYRGVSDTEYKTARSDMSSILSIACQSDCLLIGTTSGIQKILLTDGVPGNDGTLLYNAGSALSSYYEIHNVFAVDSSQPDGTGDLYATLTVEGNPSNSNASTKNEGLWAFYKFREHWNKE